MQFALPSLSPQLRGGSEDLAWALPALRAKGYAILQLQEELPALGQLYQQAREFFQRPSKYKETFKCYPLLGGYLTPYPGTYEVFELRRGLGKCPEELRQAAICRNGCSGHGSCGLLGTCICEGNWAGRDCSFQLSLDDQLPNSVQEPKHDTLDAAKLSLGEQLQRLEFRSPPAQPQPATLGRAARATLSFAQSRRAADNAWAAADKLFAAAKLETTRDAVERVERAVANARGQKDQIPGHEFAGLQAPPAAGDIHPCSSDCSQQGMCLAGKCLCNEGFYGETCEHRRCLNDCSGNGQCHAGQCRCSKNYGGQDCSLLQTAQTETQASLAAMLTRGLAAESEELAKQVKEAKEPKACPLNCNGNGQCSGGVCQCRSGFKGLACQEHEPAPKVALAQAPKACLDPTCSGNGLCWSGECRCLSGFSGASCENAEKPLQLQLQQVTQEDEQRVLTCAGGCSHGTCKVGMCECEAGWQGMSCNISAEQLAQEQEQSASVPSAASWIARDARGKALRVPKPPKDASLLSTEAQANSRLTKAASALDSWLKTARKVGTGRPVDELASLLSAAVAPPQD
ncbi:unnamed protein product [Effrenium voratum]|uniref:EGF-like domain-containing protein n=1 Tax=Effrenium voratum TaxID=2562239 RepID=A0AA36MTZ8_9DINO|nr:unnamed protein product [Effrenium voratum]